MIMGELVEQLHERGRFRVRHFDGGTAAEEADFADVLAVDIARADRPRSTASRPLDRSRASGR